MLHWIPGRSAVSPVTPVAALLAPSPPVGGVMGVSRSEHARMLAHAATRRRAARGEDRAYWKACAPAAVAKAAAIRTGAGFRSLP